MPELRIDSGLCGVCLPGGAIFLPTPFNFRRFTTWRRHERLRHVGHAHSAKLIDSQTRVDHRNAVRSSSRHSAGHRVGVHFASGLERNARIHESLGWADLWVDSEVVCVTKALVGVAGLRPPRARVALLLALARHLEEAEKRIVFQTATADHTACGISNRGRSCAFLQLSHGLHALHRRSDLCSWFILRE
jgi:hypothetical protein